MAGDLPPSSAERGLITCAIMQIVMPDRHRLAAAIGELRDARLLLAGAAAGVAALLFFGLGVGIIPNPVIYRMIDPEPFAIATWIVSAPLVGLIVATYLVPGRGPDGTVPLQEPTSSARDGTAAGTIGGMATFFAIGCPLCNKIVLVLLGSSGAMSIFAPIQPFLGAASIVLLAGTLLWRLDRRARGAACAVPAAPATPAP
jgi:hypothetical protein